MSQYFIKGLEISKLWGYRDIALPFHSDLSILIGPNASGKTTILNLLQYVLTASVSELESIPFERVVIHLQAFKGRSKRVVKVTRDASSLLFRISNSPFEIPFLEGSLFSPGSRYYRPAARVLRRHYAFQHILPELQKRLGDLVPAVWLPVSRRLSIREEEAEKRRKTEEGLESVDFHLDELLRNLVEYRLGLDSKMSYRYKDFVKSVLRTILYSKKLDRMSSSIDPPTAKDKEDLIQAFKDAEVLDEEMQARIDEHFTEASNTVKRIKQWLSEKKPDHSRKGLMVVPLISRTQQMVKSARDVENHRNSLFEPLGRYTDIVRSFLDSKRVTVDEGGKLFVIDRQTETILGPRHLSSGEKQILILLTEALLSEDRPVVYVIDEPELSLHITWQEKLLQSVLELGGRIQLIVATHSPDIVGKFTDKTIDLGLI